MNSYIHLNELRVGERAVVTRLLSREDGAQKGMRRRLLDLGLVRGATVECVGKSPCGDPSAYRVLGAIVAIRARDGRNVLVERR